uniref:NADH dehydrogenase subunit 6 n=1 Tax=Laemobothrion atrum TaxID=179170 RepID=UPI00257A893E|nr:NADH dehydrogenase subunit 6 [Laemobothrion atrum]WGU50360.1 NADH dehydrogenase subunit 6 [Laemobothrion atrum]
MESLWFIMLSLSSLLMLTFLYNWSSPIYEMIHIVLLCLFLPTVEVLIKTHGKETEYTILLILVITGLMVVSGMCVSMLWQSPSVKPRLTAYPSLFFFWGVLYPSWGSGVVCSPLSPLQDLSGLPSLSGGEPLWVWGVGMYVMLLLFVVLISWVIREKGGSLRRGSSL